MPLTEVILIRKLESVSNLPTLPGVITELSRLIKDPAADSPKVSKLLQNDPALMTNILSMANSVFSRGVLSQKPVTSLQLAIARLGMSSVYNLALSSSVLKAFNDKGLSFDAKEFWKHSIAVGSAMNLIYDYLPASSQKMLTRDVLHLSGIIHDMGRIVLDQYFHEEFLNVLKSANETQRSLYYVEADFFGSTHAKIGAWLAERWSLSPLLISCIRHHHEPWNVKDEAEKILSTLVHVADFICNSEQMGSGGGLADAEQVLESYLYLGLKVENYLEMIESIQKEFIQSEKAFSHLL